MCVNVVICVKGYKVPHFGPLSKKENQMCLCSFVFVEIYNTIKLNTSSEHIEMELRLE